MRNPDGGKQITADPLIAAANASITHILSAWYWPDEDSRVDAVVYSDRVIRFNLQTLQFYDQKRLHAAYNAVYQKLQAEDKHDSGCFRQLSDAIAELDPLVEREHIELDSRPQSEWSSVWNSEDELRDSDTNMEAEAAECLSSKNLSSIRSRTRRLLSEGCISFESY